jgi:hypothetical protein
MKKSWLVTLPLCLAIAAACAIFGLSHPARAQHEEGGFNAPQNLVAHADVALTASAAAVQILASNLKRVTAVCRIVGAPGTNTARVGDSTTDATHGTPLDATVAGASFDVTGALYGYSATGITLSCSEVVRP